MKFAAAVLASIAATSSAKFSGKSASKLLQSARKLNQDEEEDLTWVNDFSVKYQGCHHIKQWNEEANGQDDVRLMTKRLVRFRLCPSDSCSATEGGGCKSGYGDYIVDMDMYLEQYLEAQEQDNEVSCNNFLKQYCEPECENNDDEDYCEYLCLLNNGREECIEGGNPNDENENEEEEIDMKEYLECRQVDNQNGNNNVEYFAGPYCSEQGGAIKIGVFTDDQCTEFAGISLYSLTGVYIKYTDESIVDDECTLCVEPQEWEEDDGNNNNNNQDEEAEEPREFCQMMYETAGKCETYMGETLGDDINEQACNYMAGIKMVRSDGLLDISESRPSAVATAFIVIFAMAFAAMAFYVWYLRTRLGVKKTSLL